MISNNIGQSVTMTFGWTTILTTAVVLVPLLMLPKQTEGSFHNLVNITGDLVIGAMFPIHSLVGGSRCGNQINDQAGIQNLEALLYSLDKVNQEVLADIGVKLGVLAFDTCYSDTVALEKALQFVKLQQYSLEMDIDSYVCADGSNPRYVNTGKLIGVVGAATSAVSIQLASFLRLFHIPQISYSATSPELSDVTRYQYFMRTVSSDTHQARAIVEILKALEWTYVTALYEDTSYGIMGYTEIKDLADEEGICIAEAFQVKRYFKSPTEKEMELNEALNSLHQYNNTEGRIIVILYASQDIVEDLFRLARVKYGNAASQFIWVGCDAWTGRTIQSSLQDVAEQAIGVQPAIKDVPEFDEYFQKLHPETHTVNPWFQDYWEQLFNCTIGGPGSSRITKTRDCSKHDVISEVNGTYKKNRNTYSVMDAMYAFAYAVKAWYEDKCVGKQKGKCMDDIQARDLMPFIQQVSFTDPAGLQFQFYNNSGPSHYSIMQYGKNEGGYLTWNPVGSFDGNNQNTTDVFWVNTSKLVKSTYRPSVCSEPCNPGEAKSTRGQCCWSCLPCSEYQYLDITNEICNDCAEGQRPDNSKTGCVAIPEATMDFSNTWAIMLIIISCCGIIITFLMGVIFYRHKRTPIIMASGKELSFVLLVGIFLSYCSTFVFVAHPTEVSCGATRIMLGMSYTLGYAAILVKTNRIYRVFNIHTSKPKKVKFISAKSQLLITAAIVMMEVVALTTWLIFDPPKHSHIHPTRADNIRVCADSTGVAYLGALVYPFILMILCVVYAVKTRKTPDGFNETRYITFGSYSFCIMWIAFISIYFSVTNNTIRIVALCFASTLNATVTLVTLFITKAYIVIFRPQKNTRENVMSRRRTHTYETVDINNLSRMVSADVQSDSSANEESRTIVEQKQETEEVSTWQHSTACNGTERPASMPSYPVKPKFGNKLSVSVISVNNIDQTNDNNMSDSSVSSAPPVHRRFTEKELLTLARTASHSEEDVLNVQLKIETDRIENDLVSKILDIPDGYTPKIPNHRRSLRSFKSRRKRDRLTRRSERRPRSMEMVNVPDIKITPSSREDVTDPNSLSERL